MRFILQFIDVLKMLSLFYQDQDQDQDFFFKIKTKPTFLVLEESPDQDPKSQDYISANVP